MIKRRSDMLIAAGILAVLVVSIVATAGADAVSVGGRELGSSCWVNSFLGVLCPFCGMTRSFVALGNGDIAASLAFHPGGLLLFSFGLLTLGAITAASVKRLRPVSSSKLFMPAVQTVSLVCLFIGIVRTALA